jgi:hypothetical protein
MAEQDNGLTQDLKNINIFLYPYYINLFSLKVLPDPDFKYLSNSIDFISSAKAK